MSDTRIITSPFQNRLSMYHNEEIRSNVHVERVRTYHQGHTASESTFTSIVLTEGVGDLDIAHAAAMSWSFVFRFFAAMCDV